MKKTITAMACLLATMGAQADMQDDPLLGKVMVNQLEWRDVDGGNAFVWAADAWLGRDLNKLWVKTEGERVHGKTEEAETQLLYSRAIAPYWDLQAGWRHDFRPKPKRDWFAVGFKGLAPYWFEVDATLFAGGNGQVAGRLDAEYEVLFTQRLILTPELELNVHSRDDPDTGVGAGLSDMELGLRLRYEVRREFAPYIGVNWVRKFGQTADFARADGEPTSDLQAVAGVRIWF